MSLQAREVVSVSKPANVRETDHYLWTHKKTAAVSKKSRQLEEEDWVKGEASKGYKKPKHTPSVSRWFRFLGHTSVCWGRGCLGCTTLTTTHTPTFPPSQWVKKKNVSSVSISDVGYRYQTSDIYIGRRISISDVGYRYRTSDIYIRRRISISDVRYRYRMSDIDTGCRI